ncbi:unnamed protein product [Prunus armeniaca]
MRDEACSLNVCVEMMGILGAQCSSRSCLSGELIFPAISFLYFLPSSMARSDEGKKWVYTLVRRVTPLLAICAPIPLSPLDDFA